MDEARRLVNSMENKEQATLIAHTAELNKFTTSTPVLIIVASVLAFIVTLVSFIRVSSDFQKRIKLQQQLEEKDDRHIKAA